MFEVCKRQPARFSKAALIAATHSGSLLIIMPSLLSEPPSTYKMTAVRVSFAAAILKDDDAHVLNASILQSAFLTIVSTPVTASDGVHLIRICCLKAAAPRFPATAPEVLSSGAVLGNGITRPVLGDPSPGVSFAKIGFSLGLDDDTGAFVPAVLVALVIRGAGWRPFELTIQRLVWQPSVLSLWMTHTVIWVESYSPFRIYSTSHFLLHGPL